MDNAATAPVAVEAVVEGAGEDVDVVVDVDVEVDVDATSSLHRQQLRRVLN